MEIYNHIIYLIEPRLELANRLHGRIGPELAQALMKPEGYHTQEKAESTWLESDFLLKTNLVFLQSLRCRVPLDKEETFTAVFGSTRICEVLFDQWWTIRRYEAMQELGELEIGLPYTLKPAAPTGSAKVDEWLADLGTRKPMIFASVLFHNPSELQISPLVDGSWHRPLLEILDESGAAGALAGNDAYASCAEFVAWCLSKNPHFASIDMFSIPGIGWPESDWDRYEWYEKVMTEVTKWEKPPYLVDLGNFIITHRDKVVWPPHKTGLERIKDTRAIRPS